MRSIGPAGCSALILALVCALATGLSAAGRDEAAIRARLQAYARVPLEVDLEQLTARQRQALGRLVDAVEAVDAIYWKQMGAQCLAARAAFADPSDPVDQLYAAFVAINYGPFDIRDDDARFVDVEPDGERWPGAGFYPPDLTREELESYLKANPDLRAEFERLDTIIRRIDGTLVAIPYDRAYRDDLRPAARALQDAARLVESPSLRRYLSLRAEALLQGGYYASDRAWLDVKGNVLDVVIGPIETYADRLLGLKASYEGGVFIKDDAGSRTLDVYREHLAGMSRALPVEERYRREPVADGNVLEIVDAVRFSGDLNAGIKTVAASLPNDERVIQEKGAKKQIYRNVLEAKFDAILQPIGALFLDAKDAQRVSREAFVANVLLHELSHTLGVDYVVGGGETTVRRALKERYAAIEEAKADVVGIYDLSYLREREVFSREEVEESYATYVADLFRAVRFGTEEAHGLAAAVEIGYLMRDGAIEYLPKKDLFSIDAKRLKPALARLAAELLRIEGDGDYERAGRLLDEYGDLDATVEKSLGRTAGTPVDVAFTYPM